MRRRDDWETPAWLFDLLDREFHFDLDAAATLANAKCGRFLSDALSVQWGGTRVWLNPPYGALAGQFVRKAADEAERGIQVVCLVPVRTETEWWHDTVLPRASEVRFIRGRVAFVPPASFRISPRGNRPVFNSAVVIFGTGRPLRISSLKAPRNVGVRTDRRVLALPLAVGTMAAAWLI